MGCPFRPFLKFKKEGANLSRPLVSRGEDGDVSEFLLCEDLIGFARNGLVETRNVIAGYAASVGKAEAQEAKGPLLGVVLGGGWSDALFDYADRMLQKRLVVDSS